MIINGKMSEGEWLSTFKDNLIDIMEEQGYNQKQLARESGLSEATISNYATGKMMPSIKGVINLSKTFGISLDEFLDFGYKLF